MDKSLPPDYAAILRPLDEGLMIAVVSQAEELLSSRKLELFPDQKARFILFLYDGCSFQETMPTPLLAERALRLAVDEKLLTAVITKVERLIARHKLKIPDDLRADYISRIYKACRVQNLSPNQFQVGRDLRLLGLIGEERANLA